MKTKDINIDTTNPENWTDEKWVAAYLNIKPNTLRKQRSRVNYVPYSKIGGSVRYNKLKVMEYAESKGGNLMIDKGLNPIRKGIIKDQHFQFIKKVVQ